MYVSGKHNVVVPCICVCECLATLTLKCNQEVIAHTDLAILQLVQYNAEKCEVNKKQHYCVRTKLSYQMRPRSCSSKIQ